MTLSTRLAVSVASILTNALDLATAEVPLTLSRSWALTDGTGADQADLIWHDQRTLAASATESLDLAGSLTDPFGATVTFARVKALIVVADADNTNDVQVGGDVTNTWLTWVVTEASAVNVRPGGALMLVAPDATAYAVTASTGDLLKITNSAGSTSVTYDVVIVGSSA